MLSQNLRRLNVLGASLQSISFPDMGEYMLSRELYSQLDLDSMGRVSNTDYNNFYIAESDSASGRLYQLDETIVGLSLTDSNLAQQQMLLAQTLNNAIVPDQSFEINEKEINAIYLHYNQYGWDSLTQAQQQYAESLAKSCIYTHGYGVYKARLLWSNREPGLDYDDLQICTAANNKNDVFGSIKDYLNQKFKEEATPEGIPNIVFVYPNPATDEVKITYDFGGIKTLEVELYDCTGRLVKKIYCSSCMQEATMQVSELASGLYGFKVIVDANIVSAGKLSIIR